MNTKKSNKLLWMIPLGCFGVVILSCGGCIGLTFFAVYSTLTGNQAFVQSLDKVKADPRVREELGQPIQPGYSISGNFHTNNGKSTANLDYPISGPDGTGLVHVDAHTVNGDWVFDKLTVTANGKTIDLASAEGIVVEPERVDQADENDVLKPEIEIE